MDPQHEKQLFFVSVITQAKTVSSIPNTKLNSQPQNQTLKKHTGHGIIFRALASNKLVTKFCSAVWRGDLEQRLTVQLPPIPRCDDNYVCLVESNKLQTKSQK